MTLTKSQRALFTAIRTGRAAQVKTQAAKISSLEFEGDYGRTPLEEAIFQGKLPVVKAIVEAGADLSRINDSDQSPLDYAKKHRETKIAAYLKQEGAETAKEINDRQNANRGYSRYSGYDDDDHYFMRRGGYPDDDDWDSAPKKSAPKRAKSAAAKKFGTAAGAPEKPNEPALPKFTEENLKDIFNGKAWIGRAEEMEKLWDDVPAKLQKKFDFDAALAEAKRETLRKNCPPPPKLGKIPPQQPPPSA
ncbi:MAG TPA: ankyrin repeat domain-containing protein [Patescibacteria group bacterium]|nr:ankyrin repeat domain-containing protein [Patescibacteria group bacterium]